MARPESFIGFRIRTARFFDRDLLKAISNGHKRALSKFGAFIRSDAKRSMRTARVRKRRKGTRQVVRKGVVVRIAKSGSPEGTPPRAIYGHIKRFLFFEFDDSKGPNVVVGPWKLQEKTRTKHPVPAIHEQRKKSHAFVRRRIKGKTVNQRYPQRPYMVPAFEKNKKKLRGLYRDVIRR